MTPKRRTLNLPVIFAINVQIFSKIWLNGEKYLPCDYNCIFKKIRFRNVCIGLTALCLVSIESVNIREIAELCTARSVKCPDILFHTLVDWCSCF